MLENVIKLLHALGFESVDETDLWLSLVKRSMESTLLDLTNLDELPQALIPLAERMTAGEYLRMKKCCGQLDGFEVSAEAKDIKLGDTTVSFSTDGLHHAGTAPRCPHQRADPLRHGRDLSAPEAGMVNLGKTFSAVRAALERFYSDTCTVYVQQEAESDDCLTRFESKVLYADQPCRLSFSSSTTASGDIVAAVSQSVKLFISPELVIPPGSCIDVLRPGEIPRSFHYKSSGPAAVYPTHQEIPLELAERYA